MKLFPCPKCLAKGELATMAQLGDLYCSVVGADGRPHGSWAL